MYREVTMNELKEVRRRAREAQGPGASARCRSPKGLGYAIRMIQYFINPGGRRLSARRRRELGTAYTRISARRG